MARDWPAIFDSWRKPVSDTEDEKCERAERMVRAAIADSTALGARSIRIFVQGSYRNDTNVRNDSDVDIAVCCSDVFVPDFYLEKSLNEAAIGVVDSPYTFAQLKNDVGAALVAYFGSNSVVRGNKAFDVHANSSRVDADVVPCLEHRNYYTNANGEIAYTWGTHIRTDSGEDIENYPEQHAAQGRAKNVATGNTFKRVVRIVKRLRNEMREEKIAAANPIASFLIESLVWNAPDEAFQHTSYYDDVRAVLLFLYQSLSPESAGKEWTEINRIKYLFNPNQPWSKAEVLAFIETAWGYVGFV